MTALGRLWRYVLADALTDVVLHPALPLQDVEFGPQLDGPGSLKATLKPRFVKANPQLLSKGSTVVYPVRDNQIRDGYLLWLVEPEGEVYTVEGAGWPSYLRRRHDLHGDLGSRGPYIQADPCKIISDVWAYAQEQPDGNLRVQLDTAVSPLRVGTTEQPITYPWWTNPVLGEIVDTLTAAADHPEYTHTAEAGPDGRPVRRVRMGYPRLGTRRNDISFATGVNIIQSPAVTYDYDHYANTVIATGAGEGRDAVRAVNSVRDGRLRLESLLSRPDITDNTLLASLASAARIGRQQLGTVHQITVRHHPAAPAGSWQIGDDVRTTVHNRWTDLDTWMRITGWTTHPDTDTYTIDLEPSASFTYGSTSG
ncbi:hypothetical protein [Kitasatospora sp. NPDC087315]|uniref:hypothetical protein n=1 Tax=Kitasatospora sp. NPDC087315 TaxID=3364069 RepID=UPI0038264D3C